MASLQLLKLELSETNSNIFCVCAESVEDEDEVLVALSQELGDFIEYVGGPQWGHVLLSPLENLAAIEEPVVRNKVSSFMRSLSNSGDDK
jgi:serine/threonine-protein phosphatase 2A regulatory subunit A